MISDTQDIDKTNHFSFFNVFLKGNILVFSDDFVTSDSENKV